MQKKSVLERAREEYLALTYDDVRLRTDYSEVLPNEASTESRLSRNIKLKIPIVSAAMDTVTESKMAIALAKLGGIGVIHRGLSIEEQASQVARVKNHLNGLLGRPICVYEDDTVEAVLKKREEKRYEFHSFPVLNRKERFVGLVTGNDFELCDDSSSTIERIMSTAIITAPPETQIEEAYRIMKEQKKKILPLIDDDGLIRGMYVLSDVKRIQTGSAENYNVDQKGQLRVAAAIGAGEEAFERTKALVGKNVDAIVIDTAHADTKDVVETLRKIKSNFSIDVIVGNVSVGESAVRLAKAGADGIKVGQGGGSICTTRVIAGIGRPQVSAIYDCATAISDYNIPICADGGLRHSGDIPIAIAAGAHSVMMGSMLAGLDESPGEIVFMKGKRWKGYRGMGSIGAMQESQGARERYHQGKGNLVPEGIEGLVPYKGTLAEAMIQYIGGLTKGMGYVGAKTIEDLIEKGQFDRITNAGLSESHPHDVQVTKDAPNYTSSEN